MKPAKVQVGTYSKYGVEHSKKDPKFEIDDHVRI